MPIGTSLPFLRYPGTFVSATTVFPPLFRRKSFRGFPQFDGVAITKKTNLGLFFLCKFLARICLESLVAMNEFQDDDDFMPSRPRQHFQLRRHLASLQINAFAFWEQHECAGKYVWNKETWSSIIERIVKLTKPSNLNDCWLMPHVRQDKDGYPMLKVTHITYAFSEQQGTRKTRMKGTAQFETRVYRLLYALLHPDEATLLAQGKRQHQCAHRCKNSPQLCANPHHIVLLDDAANKDLDKCWNGLRALCPHDPPCIFTDSQGRYLPCRNDPDILQCTCTPSCY